MAAPSSDPFSISDHVIAKIGVHAADAGASCGPGLHLHVTPVLLEPDGHLDFGALGVFLDVASSQATSFGPFVHADIGINRVARPESDVLHGHATALRTGKRTAIVHVSAREASGRVIADSTQHMVRVGAPAGLGAVHPADSEEHRRRFSAALDGVCRLPGPLHQAVGIVRVEEPGQAPHWTMPSSSLSRNGWGGLHGGIAFDLVTEAAAGAAGALLGAAVRPNGALLRYLVPATGGPFRAVPTVFIQEDGAVFVRVAVHDDGQDGRLCIVGEVHAARSAAPEG